MLPVKILYLVCCHFGYIIAFTYVYRYEVEFKITSWIFRMKYTINEAPFLKMTVAKVSCQTWNQTLHSWESHGCQVTRKVFWL